LKPAACCISRMFGQCFGGKWHYFADTVPFLPTGQLHPKTHGALVEVGDRAYVPLHRATGLVCIAPEDCWLMLCRKTCSVLHGDGGSVAEEFVVDELSCLLVLCGNRQGN